MSQFFAETAHHKIDREKYSQNYDRIFGNKEEKMEDQWDMENPICVSCGEKGHYVCGTIGKDSRDDKISLLEAQLKEANEVIGFYGDKNGEHWAACRDEDTAETCCHMIAEVSGGERAREYLDRHKTPE